MSSLESSRANASRLRLVLAFATVYVVWGSSYLAILLGLETFPPFLLGAARFLSAGLILYAAVYFRGGARVTAKEIGNSAIIGALLLFAGNGSLIWAEQKLPSGIAALIVATVPMWMVVIQTVVEGVRPGIQIWLGVATGLWGLAILLGVGESAGGGLHLPSAVVLSLGSIMWASGSIYSRRAALPRSPLAGIALQMLAAGILFTTVSFFAGEMDGFDPRAVTARSFLGVAYLSVFGSVLAYTAYIWLLQVSTPARVGTYAYVNPLIAVFLGWAFASEVVGSRTLFAAGVIVGAVILITTARQPARAR